MPLVLREWSELLPLAAAVAVAGVAGDSARVKWPTMSTSAGARSPGSSSKAAPRSGGFVLGIGLNVALRPGDLPVRAA